MYIQLQTGYNSFSFLTLPKQALVFTFLHYTSFENTMGKGEIAHNEQFLHFLKCFLPFNPLPNKKFFNWSKLKTCADNKINVNKRLKPDMRREENIVGKGENAGNQHFLLFPQYFQNLSSSGSLKVGIVCNFHQISNCHLQSLSVWKGLKFVVWERVRAIFWTPSNLNLNFNHYSVIHDHRFILCRV